MFVIGARIYAHPVLQLREKGRLHSGCHLRVQKQNIISDDLPTKKKYMKSM